MSLARDISLLDRLPAVAVAVFGDFCLDAYWMLDTGDLEISVETNLPVHRVQSQRYTLGGAGNVAANLADLGVGTVRAVALLGDDLFGAQMLKLLAQHRIDRTGAAISRDWQTLVYSKPMLGDRELNRFDFGAFNQLGQATMDDLAARLDQAAADCSVVVVNQQLPLGVTTEPMIRRVNQVIARRPSCRFIVDPRHRAAMFQGAILKMNHSECLRLLQAPGLSPPQAARALQQRTGQTVFLTAGQEGIFIADTAGDAHAPALPVTGPIDPVGAGDTVIAALAAALAAGADPLAAAQLANAAAAVTIRKLKTTGTATPVEIRQILAAG
jgi:rfaE bifunctional protein kinase chain/domain